MTKKEKELFEIWRSKQHGEVVLIDIGTDYLGHLLSWLEKRFYSDVQICKIVTSEYKVTAFPDIRGEHEYDGIGETRLEAILDICAQIAKGES